MEEQLDPKGKIHIPIGVPNALDTLKTFVEAEGNFSPGVGSCGIYFWVYDPDAGVLTAPTMEHVSHSHGFHDAGYLIPWSYWEYNDIQVRTEVCELAVFRRKVTYSSWARVFV